MYEFFIAGVEAGMQKSGSAGSSAVAGIDDLISKARGARSVGKVTENASWLNPLNWPEKAWDNLVVAPARGVKDWWINSGSINDDVLREARKALSSEGRIGSELLTARDNILSEANKRIAQNAAVGAGVGGAAGAATADEGQGFGGFLRGAALGGAGGGLLGRGQASKIRQRLSGELSGAGVGTGKAGLDDFLNVDKLKRTIGGATYNPTGSSVANRLVDARELQGRLGNLAEEVAGQAFSPVGAALTGAGVGVAGTVGYNAGGRYMDKTLGSHQSNSRGQLPPMPPARPMPPPSMAPPPMPYPLYGYYPYGGR